MSYGVLADVPAPAHAKAIGALDGFDELLAAYVALLDTQRAHVASGSFDALADTLAQGDTIAAHAAACGRRVAPLRDAVASGRFAGPRASELVRRFALAGARAARASDLADLLADVCLTARNVAETEIKQMATHTPAAQNGYAHAGTRSFAIDRQG
ncbi:MAG TPA: hypothetical protein VGT98_15360 [Candidatus Elarobacter sp.]|nr:hypothetical protein [Candidatus Elarobacter sp.]